MDNQKKTVSKTDLMTNKVMLVFILAFAMSILLMLINRGLSNPGTFMGTYYALYGLGIAGIVGVAAGVVKEIADRRSGRESTGRLVTGRGIILCSLVVVLSVFLLLYRNYTSSIHLLYVVVPGLAIYYLFTVIFPREFSLVSAVGVILALYFWRFARYNQATTAFYAAQGLLLALCVLAAVLLIVLKKNDGVLRLGRHHVRILEQDAEYGASLVFVGLLALTLIAAFFVPAGWVLYLSYMILAVIFVMAVYFAVRMM